MNQQFDCHYDGDWQKCDKEMCHREKQSGIPDKWADK